MKPHEILKQIQALMSVDEWSPDTLDGISEILSNAGYPVLDIDESEKSYQEGDWYFLLQPEIDDDDGVERVTPAGSLVRIEHIYSDATYCVGCPATGATLFWDKHDIDLLLMPVPTVYDSLSIEDENGIMDRFTVFPAGEIEEYKERYNYLGCSLGGLAASMWGELKHTDIQGDFDALGRKVPFHELDVDTQRHIFNRLKD